MIAELELQRLYDRVRLVRGKGDRHSGTLCIMTFVALLAGERHTDAPSSASPLVRQFALVLNDAMPDGERQILKPFAPRIIGTADGFDTGRASLLRRVMEQEVIPRILNDIQENALPSGPLLEPAGVATAPPAEQLLRSFTTAAAAEDTPRNQRQLAWFAVQLLSACGAAATSPDRRAWYWAQAVNLLDHLCDFGTPRLRRSLPSSRIEQLLAADSFATAGRGRVATALLRLRRGFAAMIGIAATASESRPPMTASPTPDTEINEVEIIVPLIPGA